MRGESSSVFASSKFSLSTYATYSGANFISRSISGVAYNSRMKRTGVIAVVLSAVVSAQSGPNDARAREIFKQLIEINTTDSSGSVTKAAEAMAERLRAAGFAASDIQVIGPDPRKHNLVARYRGTGSRRPLLLLAHLDVVEAKPEDWSVPPFTFLEKDGYFYGRGTEDDKGMASLLVANVIRLKQEGF